MAFQTAASALSRVEDVIGNADPVRFELQLDVPDRPAPDVKADKRVPNGPRTDKIGTIREACLFELPLAHHESRVAPVTVILMTGCGVFHRRAEHHLPLPVALTPAGVLNAEDHRTILGLRYSSRVRFVDCNVTPVVPLWRRALGDTVLRSSLPADS